MTKEQQKAEELYEFFSELDTFIENCCAGFRMTKVSAIQCAIKVCEEGEADTRNGHEELEFWQSVKQHLEQM